MRREANDAGDLAFQLVDGNCNFNIMGMNDFERKVNLSQRGRSYAVVAIMGPQSSGKSTLMNHLFGTKFKIMDEEDGRSQTTKGIWLARCPDIEPLTLVMDMEGTDGSERGEDTVFEKRSALFALAIADVVLINMWCNQIGLNHAANKPLLKIVFQQVIFRFCDKPRKITLMFVVRDKSKTPEERLEAKLKDDIQEIWSSIQKPQGKDDIQLSDFFKVEVKFLPNYEYKFKQFKVEVEKLKMRFINSTAPSGLVGDQKDPASEFSTTAQIVWEDIMENKSLNLPNLQVMLATHRCDMIKDDKYKSFEKNKMWCKLYQRKDGFNPDFGKIVNSILNNCLSEYDSETAYFHEATRNRKREELKEKLLNCVKPVYLHNVRNLRLQCLRKFVEAFDRTSTDEENTFARIADGCMKDCLHEFNQRCEAVKIELANWDTSAENANLEFDMKLHINAKGGEKVDLMIRQIYERDLKLKLLDHMSYLLCEETDPNWHKVRQHHKSVTTKTISELNVTLSKFSINEEGRKTRVESIETYAKDIVEAKAREESCRAKEHMKKKFLKIFKPHYDWDNAQQLLLAAKDAKYKPMDVLVGLVAIRLEDGVADNIGHILRSALLVPEDPSISQLLAYRPDFHVLDSFGAAIFGVDYLQHVQLKRYLEKLREKFGHNLGRALCSAVLGSGNPDALKHLNSSSWEKVSLERTLIKPNQCKELWKGYLIEVENAINKAIRDLEEKRARFNPGFCDDCCRCCTII
ncbi:hypothetical protein L6164_003043 [Bauhinia variegata]|uniref:Uncharacterized protein n=1 Tax=Bauhinia variegata TaxID=167791 RepID=A0ACB9Q0M9_BAUVA|nr:hypothetical protein L6164_003043 [Bauhinia variegata]